MTYSINKNEMKKANDYINRCLKGIIKTQKLFLINIPNKLEINKDLNDRFFY